MLIRISGGEGGIREYLETGRKDGRDHNRAELDERVVLAGSLDLVDQVLGVMHKRGEQYLHITLSFREDHIPRETLADIAEEFRQFAFSAYRDDEYTYYAEAHLPRIKGYIDQRTGESVERKPHIHVVIPEWNLLASKGMQPFAVVDFQRNYIDAFQEHINAKYGLASPKEHRRVRFTDESHVIARYKGDLFKGSGHELKERLLGVVLDQDIRDRDTLRGVLEKFGEVRERNAGRPDAYFNVKPSGAPRGTNLKDFVFTSEFLALDGAGKRERLGADIEQRYDEVGTPKKTTEQRAERLADWHARRAAELKYLNSGHRSYKEYRNAAPDEQARTLSRLKEKFYERYDRGIEDRRSDLEHAQGNLRAATRHLRAVKRDPRSLDQAERFQADRRTRGLVKAALARLGGDQAETAADRSAVAETDSREGRPQDSEIGQLIADSRRKTRTERDIDQIKKTLDANHLLTCVARSHGVSIAKYGVVKADDGSDRIVCGRRRLNVSDFLTQEMHLPWNHAAVLLRQIASAERDPTVRIKASTRQRLWTQFKKDWQPEQRRVHREALTAHRKSDREGGDAARTTYQTKRRDLQNDPALRGAARRARLSILRVEKVAADQARREQRQRERDLLTASQRRKPAEEFRDFLVHCAEKGDADALSELRRQRVPQATAARTDGVVPPDPRMPAADVFASPSATALRRAIHYRVDGRGHVSYLDETRATLFTDSGRAVDFAQRDRDTRELGLRLAIEKFGSRLSLYGSDAYKAEMAVIAAQAGLRVTFAEPAVQARFEEARGKVSALQYKNVEKQIDHLHIFVQDRNAHRKSSNDEEYVMWQSKNAGTFAYAGWRTLGDGSTALLLRDGKQVHALRDTHGAVASLKQIPKGRSVTVDGTGVVRTTEQERGEGMQR
jgi:hypothetical protein